MLFVAGQIGWDAEQQMVGDGLVEQFEQALDNVMTVVRCAAGEPNSVARMTIYVVDCEAYRSLLPELGAAYRRVMGHHYPAMALVEVSGLLEPGALVEVEATAILPPVANE
jgi:enamine deaminase RidA (YjgF/YER057c/UK114 family)